MSNWRVAMVGAQARMNPADKCGCCGREELKRTVPMTNGDRVVWMGTGCAAKAAGRGLDALKAEIKAVVAQETAAKEAAEAAAAKVRNAQLADFQAWVTRTTGLDYMRGYLSLGGMAKAREAYANR